MTRSSYLKMKKTQNTLEDTKPEIEKKLLDLCPP